jgi:transposase
MSRSLIRGWRKRQRDMALLTSEPLQFLPYGAVASGSATEPTAVAFQHDEPAGAPPRAAARETGTTQEELIRPNPSLRPGGIDIDLPRGVRLSVDSYVKERALARVLRAMRETDMARFVCTGSRLG